MQTGSSGPKFTKPLPFTASADSLALANIVQRNIHTNFLSPASSVAMDPEAEHYDDAAFSQVSTPASMPPFSARAITRAYARLNSETGLADPPANSAAALLIEETRSVYTVPIASPRPAAITLPHNTPEHLARLFEYFRLNDPELYGLLKTTLYFDEARPFCRCTRDDLLNLGVFVVILASVGFECFFPDQAKIPGYGALPFSIDSITLRTALMVLLIGSMLKSLVLNLFTLVNDARAAPTFIDSLIIVAEAADRNMLPTPWSSQGRAILGDVYKNAPVQYNWEMFKPLPSLGLKLIGTIAALCYALIVYQNSKNSYFAALTAHAWLREFFTPDLYHKGLIALNALTIPFNTLLTSKDYHNMIRNMIDTDFQQLATHKSVPTTLASTANYTASFVRSGGETQGCLTKQIGYILNAMGPYQIQTLKAKLIQSLDAMALAVPTNAIALDLGLIAPIEEQLSNAAAEIIRPIDRENWFKGIGIVCLLVSLVLSYYSCLNNKELFKDAVHNPELWQWFRELLKFFQADTETGQFVLALLSTGIFIRAQTTDGLRIALRDGVVKVFQAGPGYASKTKAAAEGLGTVGLAVLPSLAPMVQARNPNNDLLSEIRDDLSDASVNTKGARVAARLLTEAGAKILGAIGSGISAVSTPIIGVFSNCCSSAGSDTKADALLFAAFEDSDAGIATTPEAS